MLVSIEKELVANRENVIAKGIKKGLSRESIIAEIECQCKPIGNLTGMYESKLLHITHLFRPKPLPQYDYPDVYGFNTVGICDSPSQLLNVLPDCFKNPYGNKYTVNMVKVLRKDQHPITGLRFSKYKYVGSKALTEKTLYAQNNIDEVWLYHIFQVG